MDADPVQDLLKAKSSGKSSMPALCLLLLISFIQLGLRTYRECERDPYPGIHGLSRYTQKTYGRIVPFFDSHFAPHHDMCMLKMSAFQTDLRAAYIISYSSALNVFRGNGLKHSSTPFLGHPRGRLPLLIIINLLAGDISLNPGPGSKIHQRQRGRKPKYPCGLCSRTVKDSGIQCSECTSWFHLNCSNVSNNTLNFHAENSNAICLCPLCDVMNSATSSFLDSSTDSDLSGLNPFESLTSLNEDQWNHTNPRPTSPICSGPSKLPHKTRKTPIKMDRNPASSPVETHKNR